VKKIVEIQLKEVQEWLVERKMTLQVDEGAKRFLCTSGHSSKYGARSISHAIQTSLLDPLSVMILSDQVRDGETIEVTLGGPHNRLVIIPNHEGSNMDFDMDVGDTDDVGVEEVD
jgi:ATP-dependent Clp protease ATP-binding subunit ClpB